MSVEPLSPEYLHVFRRAAALLTSSLELEQALSNTISTCLPALGDFGFFDVIIDQNVRRTARAYEDEALEAFLKQTSWARQERTDINLCALSSGTPVLHPDTNDTWFAQAFGEGPRMLAFRSMISVPVNYGDELIGSLTLFMGRSGRNHTQSDLDFAAELAGLAAPVVVNARLLDQQKKAQSALQLSEERLRVATDAGKIGVWDWDIASDQINWSDKVYELHGRRKEDFAGKVANYTDFVHPDDRERTWAKIQAALTAGDSFNNELRSLWPDGSVHWISTWAHIYRDEAGKAVRMVGSSIDITEQKNTETGLSQRNAQLEEKVVSSRSERDRIWRMSQDILAVASLTSGYLLSVSPAISNILGWSEEEALNRPFLTFVNPAQHEQMGQVFGQLQRGDFQEGLEIHSIHKDGSFRWISWTIVPEGDLLYAVGRDITELRRQRELILDATEKRLQLALEVGGMGAWQWDIRTDEVTWWPGMAELHGLPTGSRLARIQDYVKFVHPDDLHIISGSVETAASTNNKTGIEYRIIWPDGSIHWIEGRAELFFDEHGQPVQRAGICTDITQRKLTEQNLRFLAQASAALAELVDYEVTLKKVAQLAVPAFADWCSVDLLDDSGELKRLAVAHVNPEKVQLGYELHRRYPPNPKQERGSWQVIRSGKAELIAEINDEMLSAAVKDEEYLAILRNFGLHSYLAAPLLVRGKTLGVITFVSAESRRTYAPRDVSLAEDIAHRAAIAIENSRLYRSLKETDRRKDDFLAMLAHELRNPLSPIAAAADILKLPLEEERLRKTSDVISRQVEHMTELVDDLLDVSRVTQGRVVIEKLAVNIIHTLDAAVEQVRPLIDKRHHQLTITGGELAYFVEGDEKRLIQVIANLLNNAAKYTPIGGHIQLHLEATAPMLEISVIDNGIGMAPELVSSAFDLFVQGKRASDRSQGGLGLGLALVKSLIELHGGSVQAFSKGPGCGSKFVVRLPLIDEPISTDNNEQAIVTATEQFNRILIVDDNADAADMLMLFLNMVGHTASLVYNPLDALAKVEHESYDAILLDIGLPGMDGHELARRLRQKLGERTPVLIAISGYGQDQDRATAKAAGIDHYLVKPVNTDVLVDLLAHLPKS